FYRAPDRFRRLRQFGTPSLLHCCNVISRLLQIRFFPGRPAEKQRWSIGESPAIDQFAIEGRGVVNHLPSAAARSVAPIPVGNVVRRRTLSDRYPCLPVAVSEQSPAPVRNLIRA